MVELLLPASNAQFAPPDTMKQIPLPVDPQYGNYYGKVHWHQETISI